MVLGEHHTCNHGQNAINQLTHTLKLTVMYNYDAQIAELTALPDEEFSTKAKEQWSFGKGLFKLLAPPGSIYSFCGCLTMIKAAIPVDGASKEYMWSDRAVDIYGKSLTDFMERVRNDSRVPKNKHTITKESLLVFKEYQVEYDNIIAKQLEEQSHDTSN